MMLAASCMNNGSKLSHEMGHYLGLYHTHTSSFGSEAVDGSDCATEGDLLSDTPADPNLSGEVDNDGCIYDGTSTDENGASYLPMVTNLLSYTSKECRFEFTEDQMKKLLWTLQNERAYLTCAPPSLEANFYVSEEETCSTSKEFSFYNISQGTINNFSWDFGDGVGTSTDESPNYAYTADGIYTVTLTASNVGLTETYSKSVVVGAISIPYLNDFEAGATALDDFRVYNSMKNEVVVDSAAAESGSFGLLFDGTDEGSSSPTFQTPDDTEAFQELGNPYYKSNVRLCVDASWYTNLQLEFDKRQLRTSDDNYTQFVITINGQEEGAVIQVNTSGDDDVNFTHLTYDLSAYNGQIFTLGFRGTYKYDKDRNGTDNGNATFIDNISISGLLSVNEVDDVNTLTIYPNPAENLISFQLLEQDLTDFSIIDILGKEVNDLTGIQSIDGSVIQLDISRLSSGAYFVRTKTGMGKFYKK
jgi:PKD repeat protein